MIDPILRDAEAKMAKSVDHFGGELATIRTGRANPALIDKVMVPYYGTPTPLNQLAQISAPEPRQRRPGDPSAHPAADRGAAQGVRASGEAEGGGGQGGDPQRPPRRDPPHRPDGQERRGGRGRVQARAHPPAEDHRSSGRARGRPRGAQGTRSPGSLNRRPRGAPVRLSTLDSPVPRSNCVAWAAGFIPAATSRSL